MVYIYGIQGLLYAGAEQSTYPFSAGQSTQSCLIVTKAPGTLDKFDTLTGCVNSNGVALTKGVVLSPTPIPLRVSGE